jgi:hypothetical protein
MKEDRAQARIAEEEVESRTIKPSCIGALRPKMRRTLEHLSDDRDQQRALIGKGDGTNGRQCPLAAGMVETQAAIESEQGTIQCSSILTGTGQAHDVSILGGHVVGRCFGRIESTGGKLENLPHGGQATSPNHK